MESSITFTVNGQERTVNTDPDRPLLDVLREDLHLTGAKYGCGEARCGACTVLVDGKRVYSCTAEVVAAKGKSVTTIEGLANGDHLHPVQAAFADAGAYQCGYCIPGMIMSAAALLKETPRPTDEQIVSWMDRHLCRCCGYPKIVEAVKRAAQANVATATEVSR